MSLVNTCTVFLILSLIRSLRRPEDSHLTVETAVRKHEREAEWGFSELLKSWPYSHTKQGSWPVSQILFLKHFMNCSPESG